MNSTLVLIVDDEQPARGTIQLILKKIEGIEVVGECNNGEDCVQFVKDNPNIDIIFLDIEMPGMGGLKAAAAIREVAPEIHIVFSTGYSKFAVEAFNLEAFDYILKPYKKNRILQTINRYEALKKMMQSTAVVENPVIKNQKLLIRLDDKIRLIDSKTEIAFVSNEKAGGTRFFTTNGIIETKTPMKEFEDTLVSANFLRTHRCYEVNIDFIQDIIPWFNDTYILTMKGFNKYQVPVSRTFLKKFKETLGL